MTLLCIFVRISVIAAVLYFGRTYIQITSKIKTYNYRDMLVTEKLQLLLLVLLYCKSYE